MILGFGDRCLSLKLRARHGFCIGRSLGSESSNKFLSRCSAKRWALPPHSLLSREMPFLRFRHLRRPRIQNRFLSCRPRERNVLLFNATTLTKKFPPPSGGGPGRGSSWRTIRHPPRPPPLPEG